MVAQQIHERPLRALAPVSQLQARGICRIHAGRQILSDVSLGIKPGQITALIGPSGAGKTTLLKALSLLELPDSGSLCIDEIQYDFPLAKKQKLQPPWPKVTVVFQQLFLWPHLTLRQNITLPLEQKDRNFDREYLDHLLDRFKMHEFVNRFPNQASLGQRQRVALVRAMVLNPKYILLDEITSSLDVEQIAAILSELEVMKQQGIGILLVTHLLHFAKQAADSIVFMEGGQVVESGGKEVLCRPTNQRVKDFLTLAEFAS